MARKNKTKQKLTGTRTVDEAICFEYLRLSPGNSQREIMEVDLRKVMAQLIFLVE
jgi:hypothetical protein